jgi:hypothetical protein
MKYFIISLIAIFVSCQNKLNKLLVGDWVIKEIRYREYDMYNEIGVNYITTYDGKDFALPTILRLNEPNSANRAKADYLMKKDSMFIFFDQTENQFFKDTFNIRFPNDQEMEWSSREKYIRFLKSYNRFLERKN